MNVIPPIRLLSLALILAIFVPFSSHALDVLYLIGEKEYDTRTTVPAFHKKHLAPLGIKGHFIHADPKSPNDFPTLKTALPNADVLFISVRRRALTQAQLDAIRAHLKTGKGLIGIRTSSHAFDIRKNSDIPKGRAEWEEFDHEVLGHQYEGHYNNKTGTSITTLAHSMSNELMTGIRETSFHSGGTLYRARDLQRGTKVLLQGLTQDKGSPISEPVAMYRTMGKARVFYTSLGHVSDFTQAAFNRLLLNAVHWVGKETIPEDKRASERDRIDESTLGNKAVEAMVKTFSGKGETGDHSTPTPPELAHEKFEVHKDLEIQVVAAEPDVKQPLFINFDHRGRLWCVQYEQYPIPAGLKVVRYDQYLRAVFDKVPAAPPNHVKGKDRITVHEDTNGDGVYDTHKEVITGLNIASSVEFGRGGIWVLNPPYLLFYPDKNLDDVPDGDPEVMISGFGLEDTHSVANSLRWGPDGWLYGANGSTTTAIIETKATKGLHFKGQCIWRFHPETHVFEIYAEGGGNTFSVEFDSKGRLFSGTNHGNTHGMHYAQGGYGIKNWGKHGPLTNPHAYGYFNHMRHEGLRDRFSQTFAIYEADSWPKEFQGGVVAANSLHNRVVASQLFSDTSSWRTKDHPPLVLSKDRWFRPVDLKVGPDGSVYMADWYDSRLTHVDPRDNWHKSSGRIYRLKAKNAKVPKPFDLTKKSTRELIKTLTTHPNKWFRQRTLQVLVDRQDKKAIAPLRKIILDESATYSIDALWALDQMKAFDESLTRTKLHSNDPHIRRWTIRTLGDKARVNDQTFTLLRSLAQTEPDAEVRSQLASSLKRLSQTQSLDVLSDLLQRESDHSDLHIPLLLWWALEAKAIPQQSKLLKMITSDPVWESSIVQDHILARLMRRYASEATPEAFSANLTLLNRSTDNTTTSRLMGGLQEAFQGKQIQNLPPALNAAIAAYQESMGTSGLVLGIQRGDKSAIKKAVALISNRNADNAQRLACIKALASVREASAIPALKKLLTVAGATGFHHAALNALIQFDDASISRTILSAYQRTLTEENGVRAAANRVLASRASWSLDLLKAIDAWTIKKQALSFDVVQRLAQHDVPEIQELVKKHWGNIGAKTDKAPQMKKVRALITNKTLTPDLKNGKQLFTLACASCHKLFDEGKDIGPALTGYERDNLDFLLLAVIDPSAAIREEYTTFQIETKDGLSLTGLLIDQNDQNVTLKDVGGQVHQLPRNRLTKLQASHTSLMPEGLTEALNDQQLADLFGYLTKRTPLNVN